MKIKILKSAKNDLKESYWFYEKQQKGIGSYFLEAISADIESLRLYAGIHPVLFEKYHRLLAKRFPFAIYYTIITQSWMRKSEFMLYLIAAGIQSG